MPEISTGPSPWTTPVHSAGQRGTRATHSIQPARDEVPRKRDPNKPIGPTPRVFGAEEKLALQQRICELVAEGKTIAEIIREEPGMPKSRRTVHDWIVEDAEFAEAMNIARDAGADAIAEEALRIADTPLEGVETEISENGTKEKRGDMLGHRKLQVETRLKLLAKWHPKKYGDKIEHTGRMQFTDLTDEQLDAKLAALESATKSTG